MFRRIPQTFSVSALILFLSLAACTTSSTEIRQIALLAPFEGKYRDIGYHALYAAQLAIQDAGDINIDLLPIDVGETLEQTTLRAQAITQNPNIEVVILVGVESTQIEIQKILKSVPHIVAGYWDAQPTQSTSYVLANAGIEEGVILENTTSEILSIINQGNQLPPDITIITSGKLPDVAFIQRYMNSAEFAPQPGIVATLAYDATSILIQSMQQNISLDEIEYEGINGTIQFENGYWLNAPINLFSYDEDGKLGPVSE